MDEEVVFSLNTETCESQNSQYDYSHHKYITTGHVFITDNSKLRNLMTQSLNYRDPYPLINSFIILIMLSKTTFKIYQKRINFKWNHFQNGKKRFSTKLRHLKSNMKQHQTKQVACDDKVKTHLGPDIEFFSLLQLKILELKLIPK